MLEFGLQFFKDHGEARYSRSAVEVRSAKNDVHNVSDTQFSRSSRPYRCHTPRQYRSDVGSLASGILGVGHEHLELCSKTNVDLFDSLRGARGMATVGARGRQRDMLEIMRQKKDVNRPPELPGKRFGRQLKRRRTWWQQSACRVRPCYDCNLR